MSSKSLSLAIEHFKDARKKKDSLGSPMHTEESSQYQEWFPHSQAKLLENAT